MHFHDLHSPGYVPGCCVSLFFQESVKPCLHKLSEMCYLLVLVLALGGGLTCYKLQTVRSVKSDHG